ncbi:MAG: triose-phosphate isomerase, partial [Clostridiales Family XIII bacterium]|nr:triose-phosphate isomerase [Clostridiales Family XIII bacterium]
MRKKFIAGNWKMFKSLEEAEVFARDFQKLLENENLKNVDIAICA